ncbi:MAG: hypothetical protein M1828_004884 [Chrysothrix sp. TS-e1954]|nr:MAG: hypothetical protein M1828_004884 [Chrysothrix sp. TS-e1954]
MTTPLNFDIPKFGAIEYERELLRNLPDPKAHSTRTSLDDAVCESIAGLLLTNIRLGFERWKTKPIAAIHNVRSGTVLRIRHHLRKHNGELKRPYPNCKGRPNAIGEGPRKALLGFVHENPDMSLGKVTAWLKREQGTSVSHTTVMRTLQREGWLDENWLKPHQRGKTLKVCAQNASGRTADPEHEQSRQVADERPEAPDFEAGEEAGNATGDGSPQASTEAQQVSDVATDNVSAGQALAALHQLMTYERQQTSRHRNKTFLDGLCKHEKLLKAEQG